MTYALISQCRWQQLHLIFSVSLTTICCWHTNGGFEHAANFWLVKACSRLISISLLRSSADLAKEKSDLCLSLFVKKAVIEYVIRLISRRSIYLTFFYVLFLGPVTPNFIQINYYLTHTIIIKCHKIHYVD